MLNLYQRKVMSTLDTDLYRSLLIQRRAEEAIIRHYPEDEMKTPCHMTLGQEAAPAGICLALAHAGGGDVFTTYRSHGVFLAQTGDIERFFAEMYGKVTGTAEGKAGSMHLAAPETGLILASAIVGSNLAVAVGTAFANRQMQTGRMTAVFFGDGALDEGAFWESLNAASVMRIPMLFVCEDNDFAVHTAKSARQGYRDISEVVERFACDVYRDDSNDADAIYRMTAEATVRARRDRRPAFLHIRCIRYLEHIGMTEDWDQGFRRREDYAHWFEKDSLALQRRRLIAAGLSEVAVDRIEAEIVERIQRAIAAAKAAPMPSSDRLYHGVFHDV